MRIGRAGRPILPKISWFGCGQSQGDECQFASIPTVKFWTSGFVAMCQKETSPLPHRSASVVIYVRSDHPRTFRASFKGKTTVKLFPRRFPCRLRLLLTIVV